MQRLPDTTLDLDIEDAGDYGNKFEGRTAPDGILQVAFEGANDARLLSFKGFDIDNGSEVEVLLNDISLGFLNGGVNGALADYVLYFAPEDQFFGINTVTFRQAQDVTHRWGITDLLLSQGPESAPSDVALLKDVLNIAPKGNKFDGQSDSDGKVTVSFEGSADAQQLSFKGFDIDNASEIEVFLNDVSLGFLDAGINNALADYTIYFAPEDQVSGENILTFQQVNNVNHKWGITDFLLAEGPAIAPPDVVLQSDTLTTESFGNKFNGQSDGDGKVTVGFEGKTVARDLSFSGFDIDSDDELEVFVNGTSYGFLDAGVNNGLQDYTITIAAEDQRDGLNIVKFEQATNINFKWGVTDLIIDAGLSVEDVSGVALDGYLVGSTVFADSNQNGVLDADEASDTTDSSGNFDLFGASGPLVLFGGTDIVTALPFEGILTAPAGSRVVSALSTLTVAMQANGQSQADAEAALRSSFGLDPYYDFLNEDSVVGVLNDDSAANDAYGAILQVQNTATLFANSLSAAGADLAASFEAVINSIASNISGAASELEDNTILGTIFTQAATDLSVSSGAMAQASNGISATAQELNSAVSTLLDGSAAQQNLLEELGQVAYVAQEEAAQGFADAITDGTTAEINATTVSFTGANLDTAIDDAADNVADVDGGIEGTDATDSIVGTIQGDAIRGLAGNDTLDGQTGNDLLFGGDDDDRLIGRLGNDVLLGESGNDTLEGSGGDDTLMGGPGNDSLRGGNGEDVYDGGDGSDTLRESAAAEYLAGGAGNDIINGIGGADTVDGGSGQDYIDIYGEGAGSVTGGLGDDRIEMPGGWSLTGGETAVIDGGGDNDTLWLSLGEGDHVSGLLDIRGGDGLDEIYLDSRTTGTAHVVSIDAGDGNDFVRAQIEDSGGSAQVDGGLGDDTVAIFRDLTDVTVTLGGGQDLLRFTELDFSALAGIPGVIVTDFVAGAGGDLFDLNDLLASFGSTYDGTSNPFGAGLMQLRQDGTDTQVEVDIDGGGDTWTSIATLQNVSAASLTAENFTPPFPPDGSGVTGLEVTGVSDAETLEGSNGDDTILGNGGSDELNGFGGADRLDGGTDADTLDGGFGNDILSVAAGEGGDTLIGGGGRDVFDFETGFGTTTIADFTSGQDTIDLVDVAGLSAFGDLAITYGDSASIDLSGGDVLTLEGVLGGLSASDFDFGV